MGYTHYWKEKTTKMKDWNLFTFSVNEMILRHNQDIPVDWEDDSRDPPQVDKQVVRFNGRGHGGYETFLIPRVGKSSEFCKTARKPYDAYVVACLILLHHYNPEFTWSSDGHRVEDFLDGYFMAKGVNSDIVEIGLISDLANVQKLEQDLFDTYRVDEELFSN